jgi:hypothetical protein
VAYQVAGLPQEDQRQLLEQDEKVTAKAVRRAKYARREAAIPSLPDLVEQTRPITIEEVLGCLSAGTLAQILAELPEEPRFGVWRAKIRRLLRAPAPTVLAGESKT